MKKRSLLLSIGLISIMVLTLLLVPALLGNQTVLNPYVLTDDWIGADALNIMFGVVLMIGAIGVVTALWLRNGFDTPKRLSVQHYCLGIASMIIAGASMAWATSWAYNMKFLDIDTAGFYAWNAWFYMPAMLATIIAALMFKHHVIEGNGKMATWARSRMTISIPPTRASRALPMSRQDAAIHAGHAS